MKFLVFKMKPITTVAVIAMSLFISCQEERIEPASVKVVGSQNGELPYDFDWEDPNMNSMPYPPGQPLISPPWVGQGSLANIIAADVLADRKKADGWKLVYNTFDPVKLRKNPYFMLYNKYRGLIRIFYFVNDIGSFAESSYMQEGMYQGTANNKLLNFADKEIVDPSAVNTLSVDRVVPRPPSGTPLSNNRWYFLQYEIAYDPSIIPTLSENPPQLSFYINSVNVTKVTLGGTIEANVNGSIGASRTSAGQNVWGTLQAGVLKPLGTAGLYAIGKEMINNNTTNTTGGNKLGVLSNIWKGIKTGVDGALASTTGSIPGAVVNVLSAIFGGSSSNAGQTVNLTLNGSLKVDGSLTGAGGLPSTPVSFYIPGSILPKPDGTYFPQEFIPLYNKSLGVFNIASRPTITIHTKRTTDYYNPNMKTYDIAYTLKPGTLNVQWNPIVNGGDATIVGFNTDVIATNFAGNIDTGLVYMTGTRETINGNLAFSGPSTFRTIHRYDILPPDATTVLLRVEFVVRPKDGSPDAAIIKTFAVNIERTYEWN